MLLERCSAIKELNLSGTYVSAGIFSYCSHLHRLHMPKCRSLSTVEFGDADFEMQRLSIYSCVNLKTVSLNLPRLSNLNLSSNKQLATLHIVAPHLHHLNLSGCNLLANADFSVPALATVNLYNCRSLLPNALSTLFTSSRHTLTHVFACGMIQMTDVQVNAFVQQCTSLETFDVTGCRALSSTMQGSLNRIIQTNREVS